MSLTCLKRVSCYSCSCKVDTTLERFSYTHLVVACIHIPGPENALKADCFPAPSNFTEVLQLSASDIVIITIFILL